jgi:hypothetical protein
MIGERAYRQRVSIVAPAGVARMKNPARPTRANECSIHRSLNVEVGDDGSLVDVGVRRRRIARCRSGWRGQCLNQPDSSPSGLVEGSPRRAVLALEAQQLQGHRYAQLQPFCWLLRQEQPWPRVSVRTWRPRQPVGHRLGPLGATQHRDNRRNPEGATHQEVAQPREGGKATGLLGFRAEARKRSMVVVPCWRRNATRLSDCIPYERPPYIGVRRWCSPPPRADAQGVEPPVPNLPLYPNELAAHLYT